MHGVAALENWTLNSPPLSGVVLRYGHLYGSGTGTDHPIGDPSLHVDAAAYAALLALEKRVSGIFNIADPGGYVDTGRARALLGWSADLRLPEGLLIAAA